MRRVPVASALVVAAFGLSAVAPTLAAEAAARRAAAAESVAGGAQASTSAAIDVFAYRGVALLLPPGFRGPETVRTADAELFTLRKPLADGSRATTITVSLLSHRPGLVLDAWERRDVQERRLREHLEAIGGRRGEFGTDALRRIRLGDALAASLNWRGAQEGVALAGAMTAHARTGDLVLLSVQGFPTLAAADLDAALEAVERAVVAER